METLQEALTFAGNYTIEIFRPPDKDINADVSGDHSHGEQKDTGHKEVHGHHHTASAPPSHQGSDEKYYCPMHCDGGKTYDKPGNCPVCGMDLVKQPSLEKATQYTCPMHPEIIRDAPGSRPICGMYLVPMNGDADEEDITYTDPLRKFKIAVLFTLPIFIISMSEMIPGNPLFKLMDLKY